MAPLWPHGMLLVGLGGLALSAVLTAIFTYRRLRWTLRRYYRHPKRPPGLLASIRNLAALMILATTCAALMFIGLFGVAYQAFTAEQPVAEITTRPIVDQGPIPLAQIGYRAAGEETLRFFILRGDQWVIEGDFLKWHNWLTLLGFKPRYRLTRLRGRYLDNAAERSRPRSVYPLSPSAANAVWAFLFDTGEQLPLVSTVYGSAAYQNANAAQHYRVYAATSGFVVRKTPR